MEGDEGGEGGSDLSAAAAGSVWPAQVSCCLDSTYYGYAYYDHTYQWLYLGLLTRFLTPTLTLARSIAALAG